MQERLLKGDKVKVLEKGNWKEEWKYVFSCKECKSKLEADVGDVKLGEFGGNYAESGDLRYYVSCPECEANTFVPKEKLSMLVMKDADKRRD